MSGESDEVTENLYVGVEFNESGKTENNSIALVSSSWLTPRKKEVYWPPFKKSAQYEKCLKKHEEPSDDWEIHSVVRTIFEYGDYGKARKKLREAEQCTDVQSDIGDISSSRKRRKPRRFSSSSDAPSEPESRFERPPLPTTIARGAANVESRNSSQHSSFVHDTQSPRSTQSFEVSQTGREPSFTRVETPSRLQNLSRTETPTSIISTHNNDFNNINNLAFQTKLFRVLHGISEQNKQMIGLLNNLNKQSVIQQNNGQLPENFPVTLPVENQEDLNALEVYLQNRENSNSLVAYLATLGGRHLSSKTNRILRTLCSDGLARNFNYFGTRNNKNAFGNLLLKNVIVAAVKTTSTSSSEKDIEDCIKIWLKHAPQRLKEKRHRVP